MKLLLRFFLPSCNTLITLIQNETESACLALYDNPVFGAFAKILSDPTRWGAPSLCLANDIQDRAKAGCVILDIFIVQKCFLRRCSGPTPGPPTGQGSDTSSGAGDTPSGRRTY